MKEIINLGIKHNVAFWICLFVAIFLITGGALTPPIFIIDNSIFIAVGELWLFAALYSVIRAVEKGRKAVIEKGETKLTIGGNDTNNNSTDIH